MNVHSVAAPLLRASLQWRGIPHLDEQIHTSTGRLTPCAEAARGAVRCARLRQRPVAAPVVHVKMRLVAVAGITDGAEPYSRVDDFARQDVYAPPREMTEEHLRIAALQE